MSSEIIIIVIIAIIIANMVRVNFSPRSKMLIRWYVVLFSRKIILVTSKNERSVWPYKRASNRLLLGFFPVFSDLHHSMNNEINILFIEECVSSFVDGYVWSFFANAADVMRNEFSCIFSFFSGQRPEWLRWFHIDSFLSMGHPSHAVKNLCSRIQTPPPYVYKDSAVSWIFNIIRWCPAGDIRIRSS